MGLSGSLGFSDESIVLPSGLEEALSLSVFGDVSVCSSAFVSSDEPPVPLVLLLRFLGSFSSTTVTRRPGSLRSTLADGESSFKPFRISSSAVTRLRGEREQLDGGDIAFWSLLSSSFVGWSTAPQDSKEDSEIRLSFSCPSFSAFVDLETLLSASPADCCLLGGDGVGGEGTILE